MPTPIVSPLFNVAYGTAAAQTSLTTFKDIPDLTVKITVPSGKRAGVVVWFSGMIVSDYRTDVQALAGNVVMKPGVVQLNFRPQGGGNYCANFVTGEPLKAGSYTIKMQWCAGGGQALQQQIFERSMMVLTTIL